MTRIQNDDGDWTHIDLYLTQKIDARFTHGLCPECARKPYPHLKQNEE